MLLALQTYDVEPLSRLNSGSLVLVSAGHRNHVVDVTGDREAGVQRPARVHTPGRDRVDVLEHPQPWMRGLWPWLWEMYWAMEYGP